VASDGTVIISDRSGEWQQDYGRVACERKQREKATRRNAQQEM